MGREQMFAVGGFTPIDQPTPEPGRHNFVRASKIALGDKRLSHRSFRVLLAIESRCYGEAREAWPTNRAIGLKAGGIGPEAVRQALRQLEKLGYIRLVQNKDRWRGSNIEILYGFVEKIERIDDEE